MQCFKILQCFFLPNTFWNSIKYFPSKGTTWKWKFKSRTYSRPIFYAKNSILKFFEKRFSKLVRKCNTVRKSWRSRVRRPIDNTRALATHKSMQPPAVIIDILFVLLENFLFFPSTQDEAFQINSSGSRGVCVSKARKILLCVQSLVRAWYI